MKKFKILSIILLFWSFTICAATISPKPKLEMPDAKHPFLKIGSTNSGSSSIWIGAFGGILPYKTNKGDIVVISLIKAEVSSPGHPKGQMIEYAIAADCEQRLAKILPFWKKPDEASPGVGVYNLTGNALDNMIAEELNKQEVQDIGPGSPLEIVVSSGCHYLGIKYAPIAKHREWRA